MSTAPLIATDSDEGARRSALGHFVPSVIPIAFGLLLFSAAFLKGYELFEAPLLDANPWYSRAFQIAAVEAEWVLGLWLLSGLWRWGVRWAALAAFHTFLAVSVTRALAGEETCGCFGRVPISPIWMAALDLAAILALWLWRPPKGRGVGRRVPWLRAMPVLVLLLLVGVSGGIVLAVGGPVANDGDTEIDANHSVVVLEPERWIGRRCPLLPYIDIRDELSQGQWVVVLYHHDCSRCRATVPVYEALSQAAQPQVAFLAVPPHGPPLWQFAPDSSCRQGRLSDRKQWLVNTPAVIRLHDGVVQPESAG